MEVIAFLIFGVIILRVIHDGHASFINISLMILLLVVLLVLNVVFFPEDND
jgi:Ca2+/Na+ antiporter